MPSDETVEWRYDVVMLLDAAKWKCRRCRQDVPLETQSVHTTGPCEAAGINEMMARQLKSMIGEQE